MTIVRQGYMSLFENFCYQEFEGQEAGRIVTGLKVRKTEHSSCPPPDHNTVERKG